MPRRAIFWGCIAALSLTVSLAFAAQQPPPWLDERRSPDQRATLAVAAMTLDEKIRLLHGPVALPRKGAGGVQVDPPSGAILSAGYVPGVPRLGIPALYETDASLGVANPSGIRPGEVATALPASLALASTFDPSLAYRAGALIGNEARAKGFNVLLGGGMDLTRDPRNGRNFEYLGEDPLLAGVLAGEVVRGTQDQHVISTVKHFALNANETNRTTLDARIDRAALRESDLLAFEIAIERGHPGSVMCAYNRVNADYACGNHWLLVDVLKHDWRYPGWVMSDWGAVHGVEDAANGLDQESGEHLDKMVFFDAPLKAAVGGAVSAARIDDMAHRILRSMFAVGVADHPHTREDIDYSAHASLALEIARKGMVLLKNEAGVLPLARSAKNIAVIGGYADLGVPSGGGSAQVIPSNGAAVLVPRVGLLDPSPPFDAIRKASPQSTVRFDGGAFPARAAALAANSDIAIVFVTRHESEGSDIPDIVLPDGQDALIQAVAAANAHTIVVLETGNPVAMPWIDRVPAIVMAWYPGQEGGQAVADLLFGAVNPGGRLPMTFPRDASDFVRPQLPNLGTDPAAAVHVDYTEGAQVGYRWYSAHAVAPLFAFGFGLSYSRFEYSDLEVSGGKNLTVQFQVRNAGDRQGSDVPQVYLTSAAGKPLLRLIGFERVELEPGERRAIKLQADPRLLGSFDEEHRRWQVKRGEYRVQIGKSAGELVMGGAAVIATYKETQHHGI
ncbi:MAG: glycosyl hydrolase [Gammaproteobacteria bacterium]|nr:glycosyl hydrolase [Gammaproteobacteria bacterium]